MTTKSYVALAFSAPVLLCANSALAEQGFSWEGEIEIGNAQVVSSDDAANEIRDTYAIITATGTYSFANGAEIFATLTGESVTDPTADRTFKDMGLYVEELGFSFGIGESTLVSANPQPSALVNSPPLSAVPGMRPPVTLVVSGSLLTIMS